MANYNYRSQFQYSYSAKPVVLRAAVSIGASGAPTIVSNTGMGISSIVHNSAGDYTITLSRNFGGLMNVRASFQSATGIPAAPVVGIKANSVASAGTLEIVCSVGGVATDPGNGETMYLEVLLNDSSLGY